MELNEIGLTINGACNTERDEMRRNILMNQCWPRVKYMSPFFPPCAVVGGGPSLKDNLNLLRDWPGDIFAVNETAAYLSDNGIKSYLFMIDCSPILVRTAIHIKGAVLASRCNPVQFIYRDVRVFDMADDCEGGVEGGPSAVCRAPHLFLRMGYKAIYFFGCDSCFYDTTHITGDAKDMRENILVVRCGGIDYITNAVFLLQLEQLVKQIKKHPQFLFNASGGLVDAMLKHEKWEVVGVGADLRAKYPDKGGEARFPFPFQFKKGSTWQPKA
jgi:hypothetical protein